MLLFWAKKARKHWSRVKVVVKIKFATLCLWYGPADCRKWKINSLGWFFCDSKNCWRQIAHQFLIIPVVVLKSRHLKAIQATKYKYEVWSILSACCSVHILKNCSANPEWFHVSATSLIGYRESNPAISGNKIWLHKFRLTLCYYHYL